ncbi:MAG: DUF1028 domain-containing protein [Haloplanus sp.]
MTYSICVRERMDDRDETAWRFGVAAATRLPAVGSVCPHASANGAIATAGVTDAAVGERCLSALAEGRRLDDVLDALAAEEAATSRQIHGVDAEASAGRTGTDCPAAAGHVAGAGYTVAGTSMADEAVLDALERGYRENERDAPLVYRLLTALAAGERAGGDRRELPVGSAAVAVATTAAEPEPLYHDLRVDASDSPVVDLRETYRRAKRGYEAALEQYGRSDPDESV